MRNFAGLAALAVMMAVGAGFLLFGEDGPRPSAPSSPARPSSPEVKPKRETARDADFDFYVLSLSWSPTFCEHEGAGRNREQCGDGKRFGFIVHGLWPQYERGYPETCPTPEGDRVSTRLARGVMDIMPGMGLIGHQWRKHGSCSGLTMETYFNLVRQAYDKIRIPDQFRKPERLARSSPQAIEAAFIRSNPGLMRSAVAVTCDRDRIDEVRICLDTSLAYRSCAEVDSDSCRRSDISIPPIR